jgi:hypothetical protein
MKQETISRHDTVTQGSPGYASYLLRLRWVERDGRKTCQAMLTSVATKEQHHFADLEGLVAYLQAQGPGQIVANPDAQGRGEKPV